MNKNKEHDYFNFLKQKNPLIEKQGFNISKSDINTACFDHQNFCIVRSINYGSHLIGANTGLGKTLIILERSRIMNRLKNGSTIILAPLSIAKQTIREGQKFGYEVFLYNRNQAKTHKGIYIINYEQIDNIDFSLFNHLELDESSILKNPDGKLSKKIIQISKMFTTKDINSATPSPNKFDELGTQSEFLGVIKHNQLCAKYFTHDGGNTSSWEIRHWAKKEFWRFISQWAIIFSHPKDLGFDTVGYDLPELKIENVVVETPLQKGRIYNKSNVNATGYNRELKNTQKQRLNKTIEIIKENGLNESWFIKIKHNDDGLFLLREFKKLGIEAYDVNGLGVTDTNLKTVKGEDAKADKLLDFADGKFQVLITKTKIAGFGLNFQKHCWHSIDTAMDFSYEETYQWIKRLHRFGQTKVVKFWQITTDTMMNTVDTYFKKNANFNIMQNEISLAVCGNLMNDDFLSSDLYGDVGIVVPDWLKSKCVL